MDYADLAIIGPDGYLYYAAGDEENSSCGLGKRRQG